MRHPERVERGNVEVSLRVVVLPERVPGGGPAVRDVAAAVRERSDEASHLERERVALVGRCAMEPPDFAAGRRLRQGVQHGQHGRRADARAEQHHRTGARAEDEAPARRAGVEDVARAYAGFQVRPGPASGSIFTLTR